MSFLPGLFPAGAAAGRAKLTTLSFVTSAVVDAVLQATDQIVVPAGVQAGDLLVLYDYRGVVSLTPVVPTGWTGVTNSNIGSATTQISYKIAVGTESGTTISGTTTNGSTTNAVSMILAVFRGNAPISAVTAASIAIQETANTLTNQVVAASSGVAPLIVFGFYENAPPSAITTRGFSPAADGEITTGNTHHFLDYKIYNSSPANVTVSMADFGTGNLIASFYLACA